jgi:NAD(P)H-nitrite reductase large subunit
MSPRIAQKVAEGLNTEQAMDACKRIVEYYKENAKKGERLGKMIDRIGLEPFEQAIQG